MWKRVILKEKAKASFKRVYMQSVIVCIIVYLIGAIFTGGYNSANSHVKSTINYNIDQNYNYEDYSYTDEFGNDYLYEDEYLNNMDTFENIAVEGIGVYFFESLFNLILSSLSTLSLTIILALIVLIMLVFIALRIIIYNPIKVGKNNFFMGIRDNDRKVGDIFFLFDKSRFLKPAITMFFVDLFIFLWSLLLIIPGIVKSYEYMMVQYILSENPEIDRKRAFEISKYMMMGNKWDTFVLYLSFIGWDLLSSITFGLVGIFYLNPYVESTFAELYAVLREKAINEGFVQEQELPGFNLQ
ncbi:MAG: DUF975 family protein [Peptostreptococcaceae bacterium]